MSWNEGYVTDIAYGHAYVPLTNPARAVLPLVRTGLAPPKVRTACELGFGQGVSVAVHAAAQPEVGWWGTDFMPGHVAFARDLIAASGTKAQVFDQSFAEFCARPDLPEFDAVVLHGVWTWVSPENRAIIVDFLRRKLAVGGMVYLGYNVLPGWSQNAPLRQLLALHAKTVGAAGSAQRIDDALAFVERLLQAEPAFLQSAPGAAAYFQTLRGKAKSYVAHEFLNEHWTALPFSETAALLADAKLTFAASAHYAEHLRKLTPAQQALLGAAEDVALRETTRDVLTAESFRRDYWVKGAQTLLPRQRLDALRALRFILAEPPARALAAKTPGADRGAVELALAALADRASRSVGEIETASKLAVETVVDAVMALVAANVVLAAREPSPAAVEACRALNGLFIDRAEAGDTLQLMASPVTATAVYVPRVNQMFLGALRQGARGAAALAQAVWAIQSAQAKGLIKDGRVLKTAEENVAEFERLAGVFLTEDLPTLEALGIG